MRDFRIWYEGYFAFNRWRLSFARYRLTVGWAFGSRDRVRGIPVTVLISQFSTCIFAMIRFVIFVIYKTVKVVDATNCSCIIYGHGVSLGIIAGMRDCGNVNE